MDNTARINALSDTVTSFSDSYYKLYELSKQAKNNPGSNMLGNMLGSAGTLQSKDKSIKK